MKLEVSPARHSKAGGSDEYKGGSAWGGRIVFDKPEYGKLRRFHCQSLR